MSTLNMAKNFRSKRFLAHLFWRIRFRSTYTKYDYTIITRLVHNFPVIFLLLAAKFHTNQLHISFVSGIFERQKWRETKLYYTFIMQKSIKNSYATENKATHDVDLWTQQILTLIFIWDRSFQWMLSHFHRHSKPDDLTIQKKKIIYICIYRLTLADITKLLLSLSLLLILTCISSSSSCFRLRISISCFCCSGDISVRKKKYFN